MHPAHVYHYVVPTASHGMQANRPLRELREVAKGITKQLPEPVQDASAKIDEYARGMIAGKRSTLFEELGLYYIGPVDGHNLTGASPSCQQGMFMVEDQRVPRT